MEVIPVLIAKFREIGFERSAHQIVGGLLILEGQLKTSVGDFDCLVGIDRQFRRLPQVQLLNSPAQLPHLSPHISSTGGICYAMPGTIVFDIFDPVGQTLLCVRQATHVLSMVLQGKMVEDLAEEFFASWFDLHCFMDVDDRQTGVISAVTIRDGKSVFRRNDVIATDDVQRTSRKLESLGVSFEEMSCKVYKISTTAQPRPYQNDWPPKTVGELVNWQYELDHTARAKVLEAVKQGIRSPNMAIVVIIESPLMSYGVFIDLPHPNERRLLKKPTLALQHIYRLPIKQIAIFRLDDEYIAQRNTPGCTTLSGLRITLVGCGTIGGYLAEALVKAGAGIGGGSVALVDKESLQPGNLGRHRLGFSELYKPKATALKGELERIMPSAKIIACPEDVRDLTLGEFDLLIDATGEESLGYWLAARYHSVVPTLSVWIEGAGVAVRSLLKRPGDGACYRCLCDYNKGSRYRSVKEDLKPVFAGQGCEGLYVPFSAVVSVQAACLGVEAALQWAGGSAHEALRTRVLSPGYESATPDCSPETRSGCPACST